MKMSKTLKEKLAGLYLSNYRNLYLAISFVPLQLSLFYFDSNAGFCNLLLAIHFILFHSHHSAIT